MRRGDPSDNGRSYFRSGTRIFNLNGTWYFGTREGDQGPFLQRELALRAIASYADDRSALEKFQKSRESVMSISMDELTLAIVPKEEPELRPADEPVVHGNLALEVVPELDN